MSSFKDKPAFNDFYLPFHVDLDKEYVSELFKKMDLYLGEVTQFLAEDSPCFLSAKENVELIKQALISYFKADVHKAQDAIAKIINKYKDNHFIISPMKDNYAFRGIIKRELPRLTFFKARIGYEQYTKEDMKHIPFNKRGIIGSQRFSMLGIPCLYLGTTSYVCWLEMDMPDDRLFNVSGFRVNEQLKILNLAIGVGLINGLSSGVRSEEEKHVESLIELWPLVCATSCKVKEENRKFRSEYVVSQLITQNLQQFSIDGIAYISKRAVDVEGYPQCINLALPMLYEGDFSYSSDSIYGENIKDMIITQPFNFSHFQKLPNHVIMNETDGAYSYINKVFDTRYTGNIDIANQSVNYAQIGFAKFDNFLERQLLNYEISR